MTFADGSNDKSFSKLDPAILCATCSILITIARTYIFSEPEEFIQVGIWSKSKGDSTIPHIHRRIERTADITQEALVVIAGQLRMDVFDIDRTFVRSLIAEEGSVIVSSGRALVPCRRFEHQGSRV